MSDKVSMTIHLDAEDNELLKDAAKRFGEKFGVFVSKRSFLGRLIKQAAEAERKAQQQESGQ
jgi:hypothetical protein